MPPSAPPRYTVLGGTGFIGSHLVARLASLGVEHAAPGRGEDLRGRPLGKVVDCAGVTDFRERPIEAVEANVCRLGRLLADARFDSYTYLSSSSVYLRGASPAREDDPISLLPAGAEDLYSLSKATAEALVLSAHPASRVVRLGSVYGADLSSQRLLSAVLREVTATGRLTLRTDLESSRDYVSVHDVTRALVEIASGARHRVYNVASGRNVTNRELAARLEALTGCRVEVAADAPRVVYPPIDVTRVREEYGFTASSVLDDLPELLRLYREA